MAKSISEIAKVIRWAKSKCNVRKLFILQYWCHETIYHSLSILMIKVKCVFCVIDWLSISTANWIYRSINLTRLVLELARIHTMCDHFVVSTTSHRLRQQQKRYQQWIASYQLPRPQIREVFLLFIISLLLLIDLCSLARWTRFNLIESFNLERAQATNIHENPSFLFNFFFFKFLLLQRRVHSMYLTAFVLDTLHI